MNTLTMRSAAIIGGLLFAVPLSAHAQTFSDLQAQIQALLAQVAALQAQLAGTPNGGTVSTDAACPALYRTLGRGTTGSDVRELQVFLVAQGHLTSDSVTGFFGPLTERAVQSWQAQNGAVSYGDAGSTGYGLVGSRTRAAIAARCQVTQPPVTYSCPTYQLPLCSAGYHVQQGVLQTNGCYSAPSCVPDAPQCSAVGPTSAQCPTGTTGVISTDTNGCSIIRCEPITTTGISVSTPSAGQTVSVGSSVRIDWQSTAAPSGSTVRLYLVNASTGALASNALATGLSTSGAYQWTVPTSVILGDVGYPIPPGQYQIQALLVPSNYCEQPGGAPVGYCGSDKTSTPIGIAKSLAFTISVPTQLGITVSTPSAGKSVTVGSSLRIDWQSTAAPSGSTVRLYLVNASTGARASNAFATGQASSGAYTWTIPETVIHGDIGSALTFGLYQVEAVLVPSNYCVVEGLPQPGLCGSGQTTAALASGKTATFSVTPSAGFSASVSNTSVSRGQSIVITWGGSSSQSAVAALWLIDANQKSLGVIAKAQPAAGSYKWTVPTATTPSCADCSGIRYLDSKALPAYFTVLVKLYTPSNAYIDGYPPQNPVLPQYTGDQATTASFKISSL